MILALVGGCATQPRSPFFGDERYLRFGVDPRAEADTLVQAYREQSEALALRIVGHDFTALGFMDRSGLATRARVVTLRGIALALDPQPGTPLQAAVRYALLAPPLPDTQDADRDGFEEVFIERRSPNRTCVLVYRVRDVGYVDALDTDLRAFDKQRCVSGMDDIDHDGRVELTVDVVLTDFELPAPPSVRLVLWPDRHRFSPSGSGDQLAQYVAAQQAAREIELEAARTAKDSSNALRLAVELAALTQVLGLSTQDQLARFDEALRDIPLSKAEQSWTQAARDQIRAWREAPELVNPPMADPSHSPDAGQAPTGLADRHTS